MSDAQPISAESPRDFELLQIAGEFTRSKRFDYATIAIQTAVEIYVEQRLSTILSFRNLGPLADVITDRLVRPPYNFKDDRFQALWESLTRDRIRQHDWWPEYLAHVDRRNRIVHAGTHVTEDEVAASYEAAFAIMDHVNHVMIQTGLRLGKMAEVGTPLRSDPDPY